MPVKTRRAAGGADAGGRARPLVRRRTQLSNTIRGHAAEFGLIAAKGLDKIEPLLGGSRLSGSARAGPGAVRRLWPGITPGLEAAG